MGCAVIGYGAVYWAYGTRDPDNAFCDCGDGGIFYPF